MSMQLIAFSLEQTKEVLELIGIDTSRECVGRCETCRRDLYLTNIGNIARKGQKGVLYCDDANCFSEKIAEQYLKQGDKN